MIGFNPRPLLVCSILAVPCIAAGVALRDRQPDTTSIDDPNYVVVPAVAAAAVPSTIAVVVSRPPVPAVAAATADRGTILQLTPTMPPPTRLGLHGLPLAPVGLEGCDEAKFYRLQAGLIAHFDGVAWRESGCDPLARNRCCSGLWQVNKIWIAKLAHCDVWVRDDLYNPQKNACAALHIYEVQGAQAWSAW